MSKKIALFIPCYNEESRLKVEDIRAFILQNCDNVDFIFIDDGSSDATGDLIQERLVDNKSAYLIRLEKNLGKGNALREGISRNLNKPYEYFGFIDADLDIPFPQVNKLFNVLSNSDCLIAISRRDLVGNISFNRLRSFSSVVMLLIANKIIQFNPDLKDTQCGCKLFKKEIVEQCFKEEFISDWLFDIEIFLRLKNKMDNPRPLICEVPLLNISNSGSSRFHFRKNLKIGKQLYMIKKHYK
jgi:dolichyl-phosphate beta-glucosyltransferase